MSGYDPKCLELAEYFMDSPKWTPEDKAELASCIQEAIEAFLYESDFLLDTGEGIEDK